jgi:hypothetical protein
VKHFALFVLFLGSPSLAAAAKPRSQQKSIEILGSTLVLKDEKKSATQYLAEYIPANETLDDFTKMFAVWGQFDGSSALSQVKAKIQFVDSRKGSDPVANFKVFQYEDKKSYGLDFLISQGGLMEHNVWYYTDVKGGVLAYQYVRRHYDGKSVQSAEDFIKAVPKVGNRILPLFSKTSALPQPIHTRN